MLVAVANEMRAAKTSQGPDKKSQKDPTRKYEGPDKQCTEGPDKNDGQIRREEEPDSPPYPQGGCVVEAFNAYNETARRCGIPLAGKLTAGRRRKIESVLREYGLDGWQRALANLEQSVFLTGGGQGGWRAHLDFVCNPEKFSCLHDGGYTTDAPTPAQTADLAAAEAEAAEAWERTRKINEELQQAAQRRRSDAGPRTAAG